MPNIVHRQKRFKCILESFLRFCKYLTIRQLIGVKSATAHTRDRYVQRNKLDHWMKISISHASEDKASFVRDLAESLRKSKIEVRTEI